MPKGTRVGPDARIKGYSDPSVSVPQTTMPAIGTLVPVSTLDRREVFARRPVFEIFTTLGDAALPVTEAAELVAVQVRFPALAESAHPTTGVKLVPDTTAAAFTIHV